MGPSGSFERNSNIGGAFQLKKGTLAKLNFWKGSMAFYLENPRNLDQLENIENPNAHEEKKVGDLFITMWCPFNN